MSRAFMVLWMTWTAAMAGVAGATVAQAQPPPNPGPCSFTLSPPQVVQAPDGAVVTATLTPAGCASPWKPEYGVACVHIQGGAGQCTQARGPATAQVYFGPYSPGTTYVSTGRGCGRVFDFTIDPNCQRLGPVTATL